MAIPQKIRQAVYDRANRICERCGNTKALQCHHIVKKSQGGLDIEDNIILLCWNCHHGTKGVHGKKGHKVDLELKLRLQNKYYNKGCSEEKVRELMGRKLYIE